MPAKNRTQTPEQSTPVAEQTPVGQTPVEQPTPKNLDDLLAMKKALDADIKAARDAMPKQTPLERVVERQQRLDLYIPRTLASRVRARCKAGQPLDDAWQAVTEQALKMAREYLDKPAAE